MFRAFQQRFGIPLLYPTGSDLAIYDNRFLFTDAFHLNMRGNQTYTEWLTRQIIGLAADSVVCRRACRTT